jgi:hypothetical protein
LLSYRRYGEQLQMTRCVHLFQSQWIAHRFYIQRRIIAAFGLQTEWPM